MLAFKNDYRSNKILKIMFSYRYFNSSFRLITAHSRILWCSGNLAIKNLFDISIRYLIFDLFDKTEEGLQNSVNDDSSVNLQSRKFRPTLTYGSDLNNLLDDLEVAARKSRLR